MVFLLKFSLFTICFVWNFWRKSSKFVFKSRKSKQKRRLHPSKKLVKKPSKLSNNLSNIAFSINCSFFCCWLVASQIAKKQRMDVFMHLSGIHMRLDPDQLELLLHCIHCNVCLFGPVDDFTDAVSAKIGFCRVFCAGNTCFWKGKSLKKRLKQRVYNQQLKFCPSNGFIAIDCFFLTITYISYSWVLF